MAKANPAPHTYWLPNLLTAFNLFCGLLSILLALETYASGVREAAEYALSAWLLLAAMVFDFIDGKVARWTNTVSEFGVKIDSLSDFISFGIGPAVLSYTALLNAIPETGRAAACLAYLTAGGFRLARFNCESSPLPAWPYFTGLPIPAASALMSTLTLVTAEPAYEGAPRFLGRTFSNLPPAVFGTGTALLMVILAFLMVSRIPFPAFKHINRRNLLVLCGVILFFTVLSLIFPVGQVLLLVLCLYLFMGMYQYFLHRILGLQTKPGQDRITRSVTHS
ncbi:MAG: CDP-diacylglycerol--serine O-phosphatidyltransferase [candidate division FCPU426 bacterium]